QRKRAAKKTPPPRTSTRWMKAPSPLRKQDHLFPDTCAASGRRCFRVTGTASPRTRCPCRIRSGAPGAPAVVHRSDTRALLDRWAVVLQVNGRGEPSHGREESCKEESRQEGDEGTCQEDRQGREEEGSQEGRQEDGPQGRHQEGSQEGHQEDRQE